MKLAGSTPAALVAAVACIVAANSSPGAPTFQGLGDLPGGAFHSHASAVSADGSTVVGSGSSHASLSGQAFRWTAPGGMQALEFTGGVGNLGGSAGSCAGNDVPTPHSLAWAVNANGSAIVGDWNYDSCDGPEAFLWTPASGMQGLGADSATGVSANGSTVVGSSGLQGFRWTAAGGMQPLGALPGGDYGPPTSHARAVSGDGSIVVGVGFNYYRPAPDDEWGWTITTEEAFRWTAAGGMQGLGTLPSSGSSSWASAISLDGSTIVGGSITHAFRWTESGGMQSLGDPPIIIGDHSESWASAVSGDGSVIVGNETAGAFIWDEARGMRSLGDVLVNDYRLNLNGWVLRDATSISADGLTIVGNGVNPAGQVEAWIAVIPEPAALPLLALAGGALLGRRCRTPRVRLPAINRNLIGLRPKEEHNA